MKRVLPAVIAIILTALSLFGSACAESTELDTVVYSNVTTVTADGSYLTAEAIGIKDGIICYVGSKDGVQGMLAADTRIVDYSDDYIYPGFIDGHCHAYVSGENQVCDFDLVDCKSVDEYVAKISAYIEANPKDFYIGYGWLDVYFENGQPTADILDAIDTDSPIYIKSEDCHSCWTNTAMMDRCGITSETENPNGGVIEHLSNGEPSGCFRDTAMDMLIKPNVPVYSVEAYMDILLLAQEDYLALGYSAYNDVIIDEYSIDNIVEAYHRLDTEGKLIAYVNVSCVVNNNEAVFDQIRHIKELADTTAGDHFRITDVKFFMDGITESCTAAMCEPYVNDSDNYGVDRWGGEEGTARLNEAVTLCNDLGLVAHFHAIGDAAVTKALDAVEYAKAHSVNTDIRNSVTHIEFISDEDIARFAALDVIASCDFGWCYTESAEMTGDENYENIEVVNLGAERIGSVQRYETMLNSGITVAYATDYPATCNVDPFLCIETGAARMYEGMESTACNRPTECMDVRDILTAITGNAAYQIQREDEIGTIEVGKRANFIVLDHDLLAMEINDIYDSVQIIASYIDGSDVTR